jgi:hypothetical protein
MEEGYISTIALFTSVVSLIVATKALIYSRRNDEWMKLSDEEKYAAYLTNGQVHLNYRLYLGHGIPMDEDTTYPVILESDNVTPPYPVKLKIFNHPQWCEISFQRSKIKRSFKDQNKAIDNQEKILTLQTTKDSENLLYVEVHKEHLVSSKVNKRCFTYVFVCCGVELSEAQELFIP